MPKHQRPASRLFHRARCYSGQRLRMSRICKDPRAVSPFHTSYTVEHGVGAPFVQASAGMEPSITYGLPSCLLNTNLDWSKTPLKQPSRGLSSPRQLGMKCLSVTHSSRRLLGPLGLLRLLGLFGWLGRLGCAAWAGESRSFQSSVQQQDVVKSWGKQQYESASGVGVG